MLAFSNDYYELIFRATQSVELFCTYGRIVGFIGENGAGKSTTINLILDQLKLDAGEIRILGCLLYTSPSPRDA